MNPTTTPTDPPRRPDAAPWLHRPDRRWLPALAVLAVIVTVVTGGFVVAAALEQPAGSPVGFEGIVTVRPLSGWEFAGAEEVAGVPFARLTRGNGTLDIVARVSYDGEAEGLAVEYTEQVLEDQLDRLSVSDDLTPVLLANGLPAVRFNYLGIVAATGNSIEGRVTALVSSAGNGVVFDGWAPEGLLAFVDGDIEAMVDRAEVA